MAAGTGPAAAGTAAGPVPEVVSAREDWALMPAPRHGGRLVAVVAQEQLLQGGRLADQAAHPHRGELAQHPSRLAGSTCRRTRVPSTSRLCTPGSSSSPSGGAASSAVTEVRVRWRSSARVPDSTMRPARMMLTRSASASTSARMWLDSSARERVLPC